jgi:hypothetical protein
MPSGKWESGADRPPITTGPIIRLMLPEESIHPEEISRRSFLQKSAMGAALLAAGGHASSAAESRSAAQAPGWGAEGRKWVAIQVDSTAAVADGVERVLDEVQQRANVNTLLIDTFWFAADVSAAQIERLARQRPIRDPNSKLVGGKVGFVHPQFYQGAGLDLSALAPAAGIPDILAEFSQAARRRGVRVFSLFKDSLPKQAAGHERMREVDFNGAVADTSCKSNPYYHRLLEGAMEDLIRSYDVDGIMYMAERQGPFSDTLGMRFRGVQRGLPGSRTCFCEHCRERAKQAGINVDRAIRGFEELARFTAEGRAGRRPTDGYYVTLWRLMLRHPELLAWEHLWHENLRQVYRLLHATIKRIRPSVLHGMHVWPNISMNPLLSAEHDFAELGQYHDFIKMSVYSNAGGPRMGSYVESVGQTMFGDLPPEEVLAFHYRVMNYDEVPLARVRQTGLKNDFVYRQSRRAIDGARGTKAMILPGIDVDIPVMQLDMGAAPLETAPRTTRADVRRAVIQAFKAGSPGIVISRDYCEMKLENLSGVGDAIKELGLAT